MKKLVLIIFFIFFSCKQNKKEVHSEEIIVNIGKKEMLDNNSLLLELWFTNNTATNYLLPVLPNYMLENRKKIFNPILGRIVTSDFTDSNDYRMNIVLEDFTEKYLYKGFSHQTYKMAVFKDYEGYSNSLLFIPKKTKKRMFLIFNLYESCDESLQKCNAFFYDDLSRISLNIINEPENLKELDSLIKKENIDYKVYMKSPYLKDLLFINK